MYKLVFNSKENLIETKVGPWCSPHFPFIEVKHIIQGNQKIEKLFNFVSSYRKVFEFFLNTLIQISEEVAAIADKSSKLTLTILKYALWGFPI